MTRNELTSEILKLSSTYNRLLLSWGTGVGKSRAAIVILNQVLQNNPKAKILLLVNETAHKGNWKEQFNIWELQPCDITIECYASLKNYENTSWDVIVADEAHHLGSENRLRILETIGTTRFICLSATMPKEVRENLSCIFGNFYNHRVSLKDSIDYGILPQPMIQIIQLSLDNTLYSEEIIESWGVEAKRKTFFCDYTDRFKYMNKSNFPNTELHIICTPKQKYDYLTTQYEYWKKRYEAGRMVFAKNKWLHLGSERKRFLGESKTAFADKVIALAKEDSRFLCFCTSIAQAEDLGGIDAIHSKKKGSLKIIDEFNEGKRNKLFAINMLQEGMNLKNLDWGMIIQLDGYDRGWLQKIGRMMRSDKPRIVILYYKDTKDEDYLQNVLEGIDNSYIKTYTL